MSEPRCVLVIGDGATRGLIASLGIASHFPSTAALWSPNHPGFPDWPGTDHFPKLRVALEQALLHGQDARSWLASAAPPNPDRESGLWTFSTDTPAIEARRYLWRWFARYHEVFAKAASCARDERSAVSNVLHFLQSYISLDLISFNYECCVEHTLKRMGCDIKMPVESAVDAANSIRSPRHVLSLKVHGSVFHANRLMGGWADGNTAIVKRCKIIGGQTAVVSDLSEMPAAPDLVPPGNSYEHIINPQATLSIAARSLLRKADAVIVWGLSGFAPDTAEVSSLMSAISPLIPCIHVGLADKGDDMNPVGRLLRHRSRTAPYWFVDATKLTAIVPLLTWAMPRD